MKNSILISNNFLIKKKKMESSPPKESGKDKNIEIENQNEKNKAPQKVEIVKIKNQY